MEDRLEIWLELLAGKLDRLIELGENVERASRSQEMPEECGEHEGNHFAGADKMVADEPAKEAEHLAGPKPDPGDGYRILSKNPLEDLTPGDEFEDGNGKWIRSSNAETDKKQGANCWYRRKIETPKDEYREPVLPDDLGKWAEFSQDGRVWYRWNLSGCYRGAGDNEISWVAENAASIGFRHCRIKKES